MLKYFVFKEEINILYKEFQNTYQHNFEAVENLDDIPFGKVYFTTASDLNNQVHNIKQQFGSKYDESIVTIEPQKIMGHETFPVNIGYKENLEVALKPFKGRKVPLRVAIINAMSNAIGDHLIGMRAFDAWLKRAEKHLGVPVEVSFFQLNPMRMGPITAQRPQLKNIFILPNKLPQLIAHEAYIDLSSLLLRENFNAQPMVDFFLQALSIPPESVSDEDKRIKFSYDPKTTGQIDHVMNVLKSKKRPILLFHHRATSAVREMSPERARRVLKEILDKSDYFVVSAAQLEFQHERYMDISRFSLPSLWNFAAIIDKVDAVITVDTSTYHMADAFNTPTVVMFTTIQPDYRIRYYPFVDAVMLEEEGGEIFGLHKSEMDPELLNPQLDYTDTVWQRLDLEDVFDRLDNMIRKEKEDNYERCNSSRRVRHEIVTLDESDEQVLAARLQQADDLLPDSDTCGSGDH